MTDSPGKPVYAYPEPHAWLRAGFVLCLLAGWVFVEVVAMISLAGSGLPILALVTAFLCGGAAAAISLILRSRLTFLPGRRRTARARAYGSAPALPVSGLTQVEGMLAGTTGWIHVEDLDPATEQARADAYVHSDQPGPASVQITRTVNGWVTGASPAGFDATAGDSLIVPGQDPARTVQVMKRQSPAGQPETVARQG